MKSANITTSITQNSRKQLKSMKSIKVISIGIASLALAIGSTVMPASAELGGYGPSPDFNDPNNSEYTGYPLKNGGFPQWYKDKSGLKLDLCLDVNDPLCLALPPLPTPGAAISLPDNFPNEVFWWNTSAQTTTTSGGFKASLGMATEAAFVNGDAINGDQLVFNRLRIRILGGLKTNAWYRITYPYGTKELQATLQKGGKTPTINFTEDFRCAAGTTMTCAFGDLTVPSNKSKTLLNPIGNPWLTWDNFNTSTTSLDPVISGKYIGDPNSTHTIKGSTIVNSNHQSGYQNFFKVEEITGPKGEVRGTIAYTDLFTVAGKVTSNNGTSGSGTGL